MFYFDLSYFILNLLDFITFYKVNSLFNSSNLRTYLTHLKDKLCKIECNIILYEVNPIVCWTTSFPPNAFNHLYTNQVYKYVHYFK